jgi:hypothetical protein
MKYFAYFFHFIWSGLKYAALLAAALLILLAILLASAYHDLKSAALNGGNGKTAVSAAVAAAQASDWPAVAEQSELARRHFAAALDDLSRTRNNPAVKNISFIRTPINDSEYLLKTGEILSASLAHLSPLAGQLDKIRANAGTRNFNYWPAADKTRFLQLIYESEPELNGLQANLNLAILSLDQVHHFGLFWPVYGQINGVKEELGQTAALMTKISPLIKLLPALAGYPNGGRFLLILQNNDELRPSGGFIGVYGLLAIKDGEIKSLTTDDSYHLDGPAALNDNWRLAPPAELKKYLNVKKWYLRDANWSPDWPTAARQILDIYQGENAAIGQAAAPFTAVIAVTPDLVADLIRLVGPLQVRGLTYDAGNFQPLLQYNVEIAYKEENIADWDRKALINELVADLQKRLADFPAERWRELVGVISANIDAKNVQIYFPDAAQENLAQALGAGGEIKNSNGDYLMVVDANLGAFKSDAAVKKSISYGVSDEGDGRNSSLKLNYRHEGAFDWRTTRYRSYTRVYAPRGSRFLSLSGLDEATTDFSASDDQDLDKTVFGFFFTVEPGTEKEIFLNYRLPDTAYPAGGRYQLLVQRQAGNRIAELTVGFRAKDRPAQEWKTDLNTDKFFTATQ